MLTTSRDIIRRLEREGWTLVRVTGSHHVFKSATSAGGEHAHPFFWAPFILAGEGSAGR